MEAPSENPADSQALQQMLQAGFNRLQFPAKLEAHYQLETAAQRRRSVLIGSALIGILYNWLLLSDWMLIPDMYERAVHWRLYIFTPVSLVVWMVLRRVNDLRPTEMLIFWLGVCAAAISTGLSIGSQSPYAGPYLTSLIVIAVFNNSTVRLQFHRALLLNLVIMVMFLFGWHQLPTAPPQIMAPAALILAASTVFTLYAGYCQEHDVRENWLRLTRERMLQKELRQTNEMIEAASLVDALTKLSSRRHFDESLFVMWGKAKASGNDLAIVRIDIDHFKTYNQRMGHLLGDDCLKTIADIMSKQMHQPDKLMARFGGQEFIIALMGTPLPVAVGAAEAVRKCVAEQGDVTVSIGVSCMRPNAPHASLAHLMSAADEALKFAKKKGRNQVMAFGTQD